MRKHWFTIGVTLVVVVTILSGVIQGRMRNRWGVSVEMKAAAERLQEIGDAYSHLVRTGVTVYTMCIRRGGAAMTKTLIHHGNSLALVIDKPILEMLQISADTPLELSTNGDSILISPVRDKPRQRKLRASLKKINRKFGDDLRRLAE